MNTEILRAPVVRIHAPEWYEDPEFRAWLHEESSETGSLATWHRPHKSSDDLDRYEYSDVFVLVDGSLDGEGTDDDMPHWDDLMKILRERFRPSIFRDHIVVWISAV